MKSRFALTLVSLWAVLTLNFLLPRWLPGDPLAALLDPDSSSYVYNAEVRGALEAYYGLDRPLGEQYAAYLTGALGGDLGRSIRLNQPVSDLLREHLPWTLLLTLSDLIAASLLGVIAGSEAAWRRRSAADRLLVVTGVLASNAPVFFTGMILLILFGVELRWLPLAGRPHPFARYDNALDQVRDYGTHLLPRPHADAGAGRQQVPAGAQQRDRRAGRDFMLVARAKGLSPAV